MPSYTLFLVETKIPNYIDRRITEYGAGRLLPQRIEERSGYTANGLLYDVWGKTNKDYGSFDVDWIYKESTKLKRRE